MILQAILTGVLTLGAAGTASGQGLVALRVGRAETISQGPMEHAVILIEDGKIAAIGEDLPIERGIPIVDAPELVVTPGLVNCHTRIGMEGSGGSGSEPQRKAVDELYAKQEVWGSLLEEGVTTLGLPPSGGGIPGQAAAIRPRGGSAEEMVLADSAYLKVRLASEASSKKMLAKGFEEVDEYDEEVQKAREKWEKEQEKKKKKRKKDDDEEEAEEDEDEGPDHFVPPVPDE